MYVDEVTEKEVKKVHTLLSVKKNRCESDNVNKKWKAMSFWVFWGMCVLCIDAGF